MAAESLCASRQPKQETRRHDPRRAAACLSSHWERLEQPTFFKTTTRQWGTFPKTWGNKSLGKALQKPWKILGNRPGPGFCVRLRYGEKSWKFICSLRNDIWKNHADFPYKNVSLLGIPHPCLCEIFMKLMSCPELEASEIRWVNNPTAGFIWILDVIQYNPENLRTINQEIWINPIQINETAGWVNPIQEI